MPKHYSTMYNGEERFSDVPFSKQQAIDEGVPWYEDLNMRCPHNHFHTKRYVVDDSCKACLIATVNDANSANDDPSTTYLIKACKGGPHLVRKKLSGGHGCLTCDAEKEKHLTLRQKAKLYGDEFYYPDDFCPDCGQLVQCHTVTGKCTGCHPYLLTGDLSPRQVAMNAGETTYMPTHPCPKCGQKARKHVSNGRCDGCTKPKRSPRQEAIANGEQWYTPMTPCKLCGEIAPKRVNNGSCRSCEEKRKVK